MNDFVTYRQQVNFCGKPRCRKCRDGIGHGPYWYAFHVTADGRKERVYIGKNLPPGVMNVAPSNPAEQYAEIDALDRLLAADPGNEDVLRRLVLALALAKRRG